MTLYQVFTFKQIGFLNPAMQIILICLLFIVTILLQFKEWKTTGKVWNGKFPLRTSSFFASIYEEIIFRGFIFVGLMTMYSVLMAIIVSSLLFGLWHFKNIFYCSKKELA